MSETQGIESVLQLARPEILALRAYEHASWNGLERMHANEAPWPPLTAPYGSELNIYPEPQPQALVAALASYYDTQADRVLIARGSDEGIDLLTRVFCRALQDAVLICPPTFGMYAVAAHIQGAAVVSVPLREDFSLNASRVVESLQDSAPNAPVKIVWLCSPNNPTGNALSAESIDEIVAAARGRALVVVDEAYAEFNPTASYVKRLDDEPHLVVLRTLSKAHALAGARIGCVLAHPELIRLLRKVIPPYAIARDSAHQALLAMQPGNLAITTERIQTLRRERERMATALAALPAIRRVWPSEANFLLVEAQDATALMAAAAAAGLMLRDFSGKSGLDRAVRISIGTPNQNDRLLRSLA